MQQPDHTVNKPSLAILRPVRITYPNGDVQETYTVDGDGKKQGLYVFWYVNGQKQLERTYVDDQLHGPYTSWYKTGRKSHVGTFVNGRLHGSFISRYENGRKSEEHTYVNGQKHGLFTKWYSNGQKRKEYSFLNDRMVKKTLYFSNEQKTEEEYGG